MDDIEPCLDEIFLPDQRVHAFSPVDHLGDLEIGRGTQVSIGDSSVDSQGD